MWTSRSWYNEAREAGSAQADYIRGMADLVLRTYAGHAPKVNRARMLEILTESNARRLDAVPDLTRYPELKGMRDLVDAQLQGTCDGAGLSSEQAIAHRDMLWFYRTNISKFAMDTIGCTRVFFADSDVGPIWGSNIDTTIDQPFPEPPWLPMNEFIAMSGVSCGIYSDEPSPEIFPAPIPRMMARYCTTTKEAVEFLDRYKHFTGPGNSMIVDRSYDIAMIEKSSCRMGVRWSSDGFGYITAMTMNEPSMKAYIQDRRDASLAERGLPAECADTRYWAEADHRHLLLAELLEEARKEPTVEKMREIMQFRDDERGQVAYWGDRLHPESEPTEFTITTTIWELAGAKARWWASSDASVPSWTQRMPDVVYEDVFPW